MPPPAHPFLPPRAHLEHGEVGAGEGAEVEVVAVCEEVEGDDGEDGHDDAQDEEGVGHCYILYYIMLYSLYIILYDDAQDEEGVGHCGRGCGALTRKRAARGEKRGGEKWFEEGFAGVGVRH